MDTHAITDSSGVTNIVVPLDGSSLSEAALPVAASIARANHGTIHLARVHTPVVTQVDFGIFPPNFDDELRQTEQDYLATTARTLAPDAKVPTGTQLLAGSVGRAIRAYVDQIGATLVVISTHGRTGLSRMWLGSTTDWLVRFLPVPVLAVRPNGETPARSIGFEQILVALDGSERSETIIPEAVRRPTVRCAVHPVARPFGRSCVSWLRTRARPSRRCATRVARWISCSMRSATSTASRSRCAERRGWTSAPRSWSTTGSPMRSSRAPTPRARA